MMDDFDRVHFWQDPSRASDEIRNMDGGKLYRFTQPDFYLHLQGFTDIITSTLINVKRDFTILDLGCGTGRTLAALYQMGFIGLRGVEINSNAVDLGEKHFPELKRVAIFRRPIEEMIKELGEFDIIYSVGVLMHLPYELDWVFPEIASRARYMIVTAENEFDHNLLSYPRNYQAVFEPLGWQQIDMESGAKYPPMNDKTIKRVFTKCVSPS